MSERIECYYGPPGAAKSTAAAKVIEMMYHSTGKVARVLIGDGSKTTYVDAGLVDAGIVQCVDFSIRNWPLTTMKQLLEGYWPADVDDPKSPLLAPKPEDMAKLGVTVIEGIAVMGNYIMGDNKGGLANRAARGEKIGQDAPMKVTDADFDANGNMIKNSGSGETFGGNPVSHYGFAQRRVSTFIETSKGLPGWVIWTTHERAAENKVSNEKLIGPEASGEAMTSNLSRVFNNTLHFTTAAKMNVKKVDAHTQKNVTDLDTEYRIYTRDHFNPDGTTMVRYRAVTRIAIPSLMPLYLESETPGASIEEFYSLIKKSREQNKAKFTRVVEPAQEPAA